MIHKVSSLAKTWIFDLDGTIVKHNGYKIAGRDTPLAGAKEFLAGLPEEDLIVLITSRAEEYKAPTESFLRERGIRFDVVIYNAPMGERVLVNDRKPSGLATAIAVNTQRDEFMTERFLVEPGL